jgi:hypothetical protein
VFAEVAGYSSNLNLQENVEACAGRQVATMKRIGTASSFLKSGRSRRVGRILRRGACRLDDVAHEATPRERRREHREVSPLQPCDLVPRAYPFKFYQVVPKNGSCDIADMHDKIRTEKSNKNDGR